MGTTENPKKFENSKTMDESKSTLFKLGHASKVMLAVKYLKIDLLVKECWKLFSEPNVCEKSHLTFIGVPVDFPSWKNCVLLC